MEFLLDAYLSERYKISTGSTRSQVMVRFGEGSYNVKFRIVYNIEMVSLG